MKKLLTIVLALTLMVVSTTVVAVVALAAPGGKDNPSNDNPNNLYLYQKDSSWNIVWGGAWGKFNFKLSGTSISGPFNGHGLVPGTSYTLVEYNGWPSIAIIGSGVADALGNVHIAGTADVGSGGEVAGKYKVWLVLTSDVNAGLGKMTGWNPGAYLFEHNLIP